MSVRYISGKFKSQQAQYRESVHTGDHIVESVLNVEKGFDPQFTSVFVNGACYYDPQDYTLTGNHIITFDSSITFDETDFIKVVSYNFTTPMLPETMVEVEHTTTANDLVYHDNISVTATNYTHSTNTLTSIAHGLSIGNVIEITGQTTSDIPVGRYKVKTITDVDNVILMNMNNGVVGSTIDGTDIIYIKSLSWSVNGLSPLNKVMLFFNGSLLVEGIDFYRDAQRITLDSGIAIGLNNIIAIKSFGAISIAKTNEVSHNGILIPDGSEPVTLFGSVDFQSSSLTSVIQLSLNIRDSIETNDLYRSSLFVIRAEQNNTTRNYIHILYDAGNIGTGIVYQDSIVTGAIPLTEIGLLIFSDINGWHIKLDNNSGSDIIIGYSATHSN